MAILSQAVVVKDAPTVLYHHSFTAPIQLNVVNTDPSIDLLVGASTMTRSTYGHLIVKNGGEHSITMNYGETLYGLTGSGTATITVNIFATGWDGV